MKRAKPKKQKKPIRNPKDVVEKSTHLLLSVCVRTLWTVYGWRKQRIMKFVEAYAVLMQEVSDGRCTIEQELIDCKELTGIDVREIVVNATRREN